MSKLSPDGLEAAPITIRERTGRKRSIVLSSRASAFRGSASFSIQQRSATTWYVGNPEATQQLFGPDFDVPTTLQGIWQDRYIGDTSEPLVRVEGFPQPLTAEDVEACLVDMLKAGSDLVVDYAHWRRYGIIKRIKATPDRVEDVPWEIEFEWRGDGSTTAPRTAAAASAAFQPQKVQAAMSDLTDHAAYNPIDTLVAFEAQIFQSISDMQDRVNDLLEQGRTLAQVASFPARVVQSVRAAATSIAFTAGQVIETLVGSAYTTAQVVDDVASVFKADAWRRQGAFLAGQVRAEALDAAQAVEDRQAPPSARIVVVDGTGSLRAVALREYNNADAWTYLADANGFDSPFVDPGTEIFVPPPRVTASGAQ